MWNSFKPLNAPELRKVKRRLFRKIPPDTMAWLLFQKGWREYNMEVIRKEFDLSDGKAIEVEGYLHGYSLGYLPK